MRGVSSVAHWVKVVKTMIISTSVRINTLCGMVKAVWKILLRCSEPT